MKFDAAVITGMPEKSRRTFDALIRAWNNAHMAKKNFRPVVPLKKDDKRKIDFSGPGLITMKSQPAIKKGLALFTRAYNVALLRSTEPSKPKTTRTRKPKKSDAE